MSISLPTLRKLIAFALVPHSPAHSASDLDHNLEAHFYMLPGEITYSCSLHTCPWSPIYTSMHIENIFTGKNNKSLWKNAPGQWQVIRATSCSCCHFVAKHQHKFDPVTKSITAITAWIRYFHNNVFRLTQWAWNINIQQLNPKVIGPVMSKIVLCINHNTQLLEYPKVCTLPQPEILPLR